MPTAADTPAYFNLAQSILIFLAFVLAVFIILTCKKIYFRIKYSKRYYIFPKIDIKGIANISMVISIAIAIILLLTVVTGGLMGIVFRVYPGFRVTIEGILIKIGGLIFGPVVGLFIAALTDILSILLTAGMFHYGYFIAALAYGVLSGLVKTSLNMSKNNEVKFAFFSTILLLIFAFVTIGNVELQTGPFGGQMFGMDISIPKYVIMIIDAAAFILAFVTI
jgi:LytS/YehU family sensor histidine kinase